MDEAQRLSLGAQLASRCWAQNAAKHLTSRIQEAGRSSQPRLYARAELPFPRERSLAAVICHGQENLMI